MQLGGDKPAAGKPYLASQHLVEGLHKQRLAQEPSLGYIQALSKSCRYYVIIYFFF